MHTVRVLFYSTSTEYFIHLPCLAFPQLLNKPLLRGGQSRMAFPYTIVLTIVQYSALQE